MIYLASLPRSGSTLLTSLLNQRGDTYATPTSNLCDTMGAAVREWEQNPTTKATNGTEEDLIRILKGISESRYATEKMVFDKSRSWTQPQIIETVSRFQEVKIVATVRPIVECLASFVNISKPGLHSLRLIDPSLYLQNLNEFLKGPLANHFFSSYQSLKAGYEAYPEKFLLIEYDSLVNDTQNQMDRISEFVGSDKFVHDLNSVPDSREEDKAWGIEDLHSVRPVVSNRNLDVTSILGENIVKRFEGGEFWNDKPEPVREPNLLDIQVEAGLRGDFKKGWEIAQQADPDDNRASFNRGWYELQRGNLQKGHKLLDQGRLEDVFGNRKTSGTPDWNGGKGTVLLNLEGGLGDQIHGFRFAKDIESRGCKVVIACSAELAPIFAEQFITVQSEVLGGVYHDYYCPSMSAILPLGYEYSDIKGEAYISRTAEPIPGRIGVRWQGNSKFEHEQHRVFPADLMFEAVRGSDCISLQRDEGTDLKPSWMPQADVSDWNETRKSISQCEKVITSCTSVAHLSAAMGIETWIVVPILSYYLWALPGNQTPFYNSVTLFRQKKYGDWSAPFDEIKTNLNLETEEMSYAA